MLLFSLFLAVVLVSLAISFLPAKVLLNETHVAGEFDSELPPIDMTEAWTSIEEMQVFSLSDYEESLNEVADQEELADLAELLEPEEAESLKLDFEPLKEAA